MAELGVGYISIVPEVSKISPGIAQALGDAEAKAERKGHSMGVKLSGALGKAMKVGAASVGIAAGGAIGVGLTKGLGRLTAVENAQAKLTGLGNSGRDVSMIMDNALASVKGTAFGLDAAATTAAMAVASGIKPGQQLEQVLKTVADTAGIAGASMDEMGMIFGSVAARGKLQGDDLMQLQSRGIPVLQMLAEQSGKTAGEVSEMVRKGEVDFAAFERALRENVGGAALEAGNTLQGAYKNTIAAAGRAGATIESAFTGVMRYGMQEATAGLDVLNDKLKPIAVSVEQFLDGTVVPGLQSAKAAAVDFFQSAQVQAFGASVRAVLDQMQSAGQALLPVIGSLASSLGQAGLQLGQAGWNVFADALSGAASAAGALAGPLNTVTGFLAKHPGLVSAAVAAWAGFKFMPTVAEKLSGSLQGLNNRVGGMREQFNTVTPYANKLREAMANNGVEISRLDAKMMALGDTGSGIAQKMAQSYVKASGPMQEYARGQRELGAVARVAAIEAGDGWVAADRIIAQAGHGMAATVTNLAGNVSGAGAAMFTGLKGAATSVVDAFGGPFSVAMMAAAAGVAVVSAANNRARAASEQYARSIADAADTNREFTAAVAGSSGALSEQAQELAKNVVETSTAGLKAFQTQVDGFVYKIPAPDSTEFTGAIAEMALGVEWQEKTMWRGSQNYARYSAMVSEVSKANKDMVEYLKDSGRSVEDLSEIVSKGGPEFDALVSHMRGLGDGGTILANELQRSRDELNLTIQAAQRVDPAMVQASQGIDVLADSAASGQGKLAALHQVLQAMGLAPKDAEQAMMDAAKAVDEIVEAAAQAARPVEQLGDALFDMDGKLDPANESARDLHERLSSMSGDLQNVAVNGGDVQAAMEGMAPAISATAAEFGLTEERVRELLERYGAVPDVLETLVSLDGAAEATKEIGEVWAALKKMESDGASTIEIGAVGDKAKAVMDELDVLWRETIGPNGQKNIEISAADGEAIAAIQRVTQMAAELGDREFSPSLLLDTSQVQVSAAQAQMLLDALDIQEPTPTAKMIIDDLQANHAIAMGDLAFLAEQSPTPKADLDKALLDAGVKVSKEQLADLDKTKTTPKIDVDNRQAKKGIDETKGWLATLGDKVVNIFTRRQDAGGSSRYADGAVRYAADGLLSQQQPQIAAGGQWITWAEDETQGESFIPHALSKRRRSTQILAETAHIFGLGLVDRGGNEVRRDGTSVAATSRSFMADGGVTPGQLLSFFEGKRVNAQQASQSLQGAKYTWGGFNWGDCSSTQGQGALFAAGLPATNGRFMSTGNAAQQLASIGFKSGLGSGPRYAIGWFNGGPYGGHASGTIYFADGSSVNVEMGGGAGGQGKIGGAAAGASHSQFTSHAYLPLGAGGLDGDLEIDSTSTSGVTFRGGRSVSWGEAQELFDQARAYAKHGKYWERSYGEIGRGVAGAISNAISGIPTFDVGGRWPTGALGRNESTEDEIVLTNEQWRHNSRIAMALPEAASGMYKAGWQIGQAAKQFTFAVDGAQHQVLNAGRGLGGDFLGSAEVVRDAEQGLLDTRANVATQAEDIPRQEREVAEARKALADAEAKGGGLSVQQRRKLQDAEEALTKARQSGNADKIAAAEKRLARTREDADAALAKSQDKNAAEVRKAQDRLNKAEDKLRDTRQAHAEALVDLEAAERTAIAARYQAASDLAVGIGEQIDKQFQAIAGLFDQFARLAGYVADLRQQISKLQMQERMLGLERLQSLADLQIKTADVDRARLRGVIGVAQAEYELEQAREKAKWAGLTSIEAMSGAMDRFYETGKFAIEGLTESEIENSREVKEALWGVEVARKRAALDELDAARAREIATLRAAEATLQQMKATQLLQLSTQHLTQAAVQLNGMTKNQATGAAAGFRGAGKIGSGLGKVAGGIAAALAGFAVAGPLGVIPGLILAAKGAGDTAKGAIDVHNNRAEMDKAWKKMNAGSKAAVIGGAALGGVASAAGGVLGGASGGAAGAELGDAIIDATVGSVTHSIGSRLEALERRQADERQALERKFALAEHELNMKSLDKEVDYIYSRDRAASDLEFATLMRESVAAPTEKLEKAYRDAAEAEKQRSEKHHAEQMRSRGESQRIQSEQLEVEKQLPKLLGSILQAMPEQARSQVSGVGYLARV